MAGYKKESFADRFIPQKGDEPQVRIRKIVTIVSAIVLIAALTVLTVYFAGQARNRHEIEERRKAHETDISVITQTTVPPETETTVTETEPPPLVVLDSMTELLAQNPDTVGWLSVPNTNVNDVVLQAADNDYYLNRDFKGNKSIAGQLYADRRCTVSDYNWNQSNNIIIYGHNMVDGSMFGTLKKYKIKKNSTGNFSFYKENPTFTFSNLYEDYTYKIVAMFVIEARQDQVKDGEFFDYHNYIKFSKKRPFEKFKENILARTAVNTGVDFNKDDKFMTLSTCSNEFEDSRFVVIGRRVRDGESPEVDTSKAEINEDMLEPDYDYIYNR